MRALTWLFRHTLNSVPFGIATLVAIALYIGIGSGCVSLREHLEMDELLFFNWWPFKLLIASLVANLVVVTVTRIPLTPPRYGVWSIHMGIILLVMSLSAYYSLKREGLVPLTKGRTTENYYDRWDRALFVRTQFGTGPNMPLDGLPRFREYDTQFGDAAALDRKPFRGLSPRVPTLDPVSRQPMLADLGTALGLGKPVSLDVVAYYPVATAQRYRIDPTVNNVGLRVRVGEASATDKLPVDGPGGWLVANQPLDSILPIGPAVLEHRHLPSKAEVDFAAGAAKRLHKLTINVGTHSEERFVEPGETFDVAGTPYTLTIEGFTPQFELSDGSGRADVLTVHVERHTPSTTRPSTQPTTQSTPTDFRRQLLSGNPKQTDFDLHATGAGPFGKRIRDGLLDSDIQLGYVFHDPTKLLPTMEAATVKYLLFTAGDAPGITLLRVSSRESSVLIAGEDHVNLHITAPAPMLAGGGEQDVTTLNLERLDHVAASNGIVATPKEARTGQAARQGDGQMVKVRVRCGDWSQEVAVPYDAFAGDNQWNDSPRIKIPGATGEFQLCLGNRRLPLPMNVRLDAFEPIAYAGGDTSRAGVMRDFHSKITLIDRETGQSQQQSTSLNNPAFFDLPSNLWLIPGQSWLLSQATWNPNDHDQTTLQIGNRPGVGMMVFACVLIFGGLLYAFYAKPLIIRRMKANALRRAMEKKQRPISNEIVEPISGPLSPVPGREG